jgi:hypothetical protein
VYAPFRILPLSAQIKIHQVKRYIFPVYLEERREAAQPVKAVFFIKAYGAGIVAAHLEI